MVNIGRPFAGLVWSRCEPRLVSLPGQGGKTRLNVFQSRRSYPPFADVPYRHAVQFSTPPFFTYTATSHSLMGKRTRCESTILRRPSQVPTETENRTRQSYTASRVNTGSRLVHQRDRRFYCEGEFSISLLQLHLTLSYRTWQTPLHDRRWSSILMHRGS